MERYYKHKIENLININKLVTIHYMECQNNFTTEGERHDFWEILYVDKGNLYVKTDYNEIFLKEGDIIFHTPNEFHAIKADGINAPNLFIISFECSSPAINVLQQKHYALPPHLKQFIINILDESYNTFELSNFNPELKKLKIIPKPCLGGQQMIQTYLEQFIILLIRNEIDKSPSQTFFMTNEEITNTIVENIISLLKDNLTTNLTINDICFHLNYGKTYLSKIFKEYTHKSIMNYYRELKIQKAKLLLRERNLNCTQISDYLGFDSLSHFSNTFKAFTKMSPSKYITSTKSNKNS